MAVLAIALAGTGFYVRGLDTVYPKVTLDGVALGGKTFDEAVAALEAAGYGDSMAAVAATVQLPNGEMLTITGEEAGFTAHPQDAAQRAMDYGRDGGLISRVLAYVGCIFSATELGGDDHTALDEAYIRGETSRFAKEFNRAMVEDAYTVTETEIVLIKGSASTIADEEEVYALMVETLLQSLAEKTPLRAEYAITRGETDPVDLNAVHGSVYREPISAVYDPETKSVTESVAGLTFDVADAQRRYDQAEAGETVIIPLVQTPPEVTTESLTALLFRDVLAETSNYVSGSSNRVSNVSLSAEIINGLILNPGEEFSFNGVVGQRTAARGFKAAGAYAAGREVTEIGGGICQVSSTIYYCVLYADLEVTSRRNHQFTVSYVPLGMDATVNWGTTDFKFKNNTDYPIRLETYVQGGNLYVKLHGTKTTDHSVKMEYVELSRTNYEVIEKEDPRIAQGTTQVDTSGRTGYSVETFKYIYDGDGSLISKTSLGRSTYNMQNRVILVPVKPPEPSEEPTPPPAGEPTEEPTEPPGGSVPVDGGDDEPAEAHTETPEGAVA